MDALLERNNVVPAEELAARREAKRRVAFHWYASMDELPDVGPGFDLQKYLDGLKSPDV